MAISKKILITGASSGFGSLTAKRLLRNGHVVIVGLRGGEERARPLFKEFEALWGSRLFALDLHAEVPAHAETARQLIDGRFGGELDVLINNAGYGLFGALEDASEEELRRQFDVNFFGVARLTTALLPALRKARGRVIVVGSAVGIASLPMYGAYAASKHALEGLFESLWYDLRPHGVQVAIVQPGGFRTEFSTRSRFFATGSQKPSSPYYARTQALQNALAGKQYRLGNPERVARLLARLVERRKIALRHAIGTDVYGLLFLKRILPENWRVHVTNFVFRIFARPSGRPESH